MNQTAKLSRLVLDKFPSCTITSIGYSRNSAAISLSFPTTPSVQEIEEFGRIISDAFSDSYHDFTVGEMTAGNAVTYLKSIGFRDLAHSFGHLDKVQLVDIVKFNNRVFPDYPVQKPLIEGAKCHMWHFDDHQNGIYTLYFLFSDDAISLQKKVKRFKKIRRVEPTNLVSISGAKQFLTDYFYRSYFFPLNQALQELKKVSWTLFNSEWEFFEHHPESYKIALQLQNNLDNESKIDFKVLCKSFADARRPADKCISELVDLYDTFFESTSLDVQVRAFCSKDLQFLADNFKYDLARAEGKFKFQFEVVAYDGYEQEVVLGFFTLKKRDDTLFSEGELLSSLLDLAFLSEQKKNL